MKVASSTARRLRPHSCGIWSEALVVPLKVPLVAD